MTKVFLNEFLVYIKLKIDTAQFVIVGFYPEFDSIFDLLDEVSILPDFQKNIIDIVMPLLNNWSQLTIANQITLAITIFHVEIQSSLLEILTQFDFISKLQKLPIPEQQKVSSYILQTGLNNQFVDQLYLTADNYLKLKKTPPCNVEIANEVASFLDENAAILIKNLLQNKESFNLNKKKFYMQISKDEPNKEFLIERLFEFILYAVMQLNEVKRLPINSFFFKYMQKLSLQLNFKVKFLRFISISINKEVSFQLLKIFFNEEEIHNNFQLLLQLQIPELYQIILMQENHQFNEETYQQLEETTYYEVYGLLMAVQNQNIDFNVEQKMLENINKLQINLQYLDVINMQVNSFIVQIYLRCYVNFNNQNTLTSKIKNYCKFYDLLRKYQMPTYKQIQDLLKLDISQQYFIQIQNVLLQNYVTNEKYSLLYYLITKNKQLERINYINFAIENLVLSINQTFILIKEEHKQILNNLKQQLTELYHSRITIVTNLFHRFIFCIENSQFTLLYERKLSSYFLDSIEIVNHEQYDIIFDSLMLVSHQNYQQNVNYDSLSVLDFDIKKFTFKNFLEPFFVFLIENIRISGKIIISGNKYKINIVIIEKFINFTFDVVVYNLQGILDEQEKGVYLLVKEEIKHEISCQKISLQEVNQLVKFLNNFDSTLFSSQQQLLLKVIIGKLNL